MGGEAASVDAAGVSARTYLSEAVPIKRAMNAFSGFCNHDEIVFVAS